MEKAWQDTGMLAEAVLHAHSHGRPSLRSLVQEWNRRLQKEVDPIPTTKMDVAAAFLATLEESKFTSLRDSSSKPPTEILPLGMASLYGPNIDRSVAKKPGLSLHQKLGNQLQNTAPPISAESVVDSSVGAPTPEQPDSTNSKPQFEPDVHAPPVIDKAMEDNEQTSSARDPNDTEGGVPPESTDSEVAKDESNQQEKDVDDARKEIDFI